MYLHAPSLNPRCVRSALVAFVALSAGVASARDACIIGPHDGVDPADAATTTMLVCEELLALGVDVDDPGPSVSGRAGWEVTLRKLGDGVLLSLARRDANGVAVRTERLQLDGFKQVPTAARRLAKAVVDGKSVDDTQKVHNLVGSETHQYEKKPGEFFFSVGLLMGAHPGTDTGLATGFALGVFYEMSEWAFGSELRFMSGGYDDRYLDEGNRDSNSASSFAWGVGGRYFFNKSNFSPYVGGGLALMDVGHARGDDYWGDNASGAGAYVQVGVELFRLYRGRMMIDFRADLPFFEGGSQGDGRHNLYVVPLSTGLSFAW